MNETLNYNFYNTLIFSGIVYGLLFCSKLFLNKKFSSEPTIYLLFTILSLTISNLQYWLMDVELLVIPDLYYIQFELLILPFFYRFLKSYLGLKNSKFKNFIFIPFVLGMMYQIITILASISLKKLFIYNSIVEFSTIFFNLFLIIICLVEIFRYNKNNFVNEVKIRTKWILHCIIIGLSICILWIFLTFLFKFNSDINLSVYHPLWLSLSALIYFIGNKAILELKIFNERKDIRFIRKLLKNTIKKDEILKTRSKSEEVFILIYDEIALNKLYLNPNLTASTITDNYKISNGYLSQIFSKYAKESFTDYINKLRIKEAQEMLVDNKYDNYTIVAIGLESGFNSKSTFFQAFKKHTGRTPTEYRNDSLNKMNPVF
jgi:AraC-like DNA-binding protein